VPREVYFAHNAERELRGRAPTGAHCQEGESPSQAIALRACNRMLLRRREAGWGAQEVSHQSVREELDSAKCLDEPATEWRSRIRKDRFSSVWVAVKGRRTRHGVVGDGMVTEGNATLAWGDLNRPGRGSSGVRVPVLARKAL